MSNTYFSWGLEKPSGDLVLYSGDFVYGKIRHASGGKFLATCHNVPGKGREFFTKAVAMEWVEHHFNKWDGTGESPVLSTHLDVIGEAP